MQFPKAVARQFQSGVVSCGPNIRAAKRDASGKGNRAFECSCSKRYPPVEYFLRYLRGDDVKKENSYQNEYEFNWHLGKPE